MKQKIKILFLGILLVLLQISCKKDESTTPEPTTNTSVYVHPGILHTSSSLTYTKTKIAAGSDPWTTTYAAFSASKWASLTYQMEGPTVIMTRSNSADKAAMEDDCYAVYAQAIMWKLTGNDAYAQNAINILNAWSSTLTGFGPTDDPANTQLAPAFNGFIMVNGAELVRDYSGWNANDFKRCQDMFRNIFYASIKNIVVQNAHGTWDGANVKAIMAFGVFLDDKDMFESAYNYFYNGEGYGTINHYIMPTGQTEECGRKQGYTQLGLDNFSDACEIGYNQGKPDMWIANDTVIKKAFEYVAKYNLGEDVPFSLFTPTIYQTDSYAATTISTDGRGNFKPIYYKAYNHFHNRLGLSMPYVKRVLEEDNTIEKMSATATDDSGWGSMLFYQPNGDPLDFGNVGALDWEFASIGGWQGVSWAENSTVAVEDGQMVISASGSNTYIRAGNFSATLDVAAYPYLAVKITQIPALESSTSDWAIQGYWKINGNNYDFRYVSQEDLTLVGTDVYVLKWTPKTDKNGSGVSMPTEGTLVGGLYFDFGDCEANEVAKVDWVRSYKTFEEVPTE